MENETSKPKALSPKEIGEIRELAEEDLYFFGKGILGFDWLTSHVHRPVCEVLADEGKRKVKIVLPRSWLKSTVGSCAYPIWRAMRNPNNRALIVQNSFKNAALKLTAIRKQFEGNDVFKAIFPDRMPNRTCIWSSESLSIPRDMPHPEGTFDIAGTGTRVTSRHYDDIIEDDTVAPDLDQLTAETVMPSKSDIEQAIGWHKLASPLLVNPMESRNIVIGTRWYERDLMSWIDENQPQFFSITRACREDKDGNPSENGELTYPERFNDEVLEDLKSSMGPYFFSCLYLNKPIRSEDMLFGPDWFSYYETEPLNLAIFTTVDLAGDPEDAKGIPDYNVVMTCGKDLTTGHIYVLDYFHKRCNPGETIDAIFKHVELYHPLHVGVESVGYQRMMKYSLRERMRESGKFFLVKDINDNKRNKNARISGLQPLVHSATLHFRRSHKDLINELISFPLGANDDLADALAMQLEMWYATKTKRDMVKENNKNHPLSFDMAEKTLTDRWNRRYGSALDLLSWARN